MALKMLRLFDLILSVFLLLLLSPLLVFVCLWNYCTGEHEIFFKQIRMGKNGEEFEILKFATMVKNSENIGGGGFTEINDPRLLVLGSFLRKTKIDELPQLLNVLRGEMSLVGFRPIVRQSFVRAMEIGNKEIYSVLPGMTGPASIILRNEDEIIEGVEDKKKYYDDHVLPVKVSLDDWWARNRNVYNYFVVLLLTALSLVTPPDILPLNLLKNLPKSRFPV